MIQKENTAEYCIEFLAGDTVDNLKQPLPHLNFHHQSIISSLSMRSTDGRPFTEKQGKLVLTLIRTYRRILKNADIDVESIIEHEIFRQSLEKSPSDTKVILIDSNQDNKDEIQIAFPYHEMIISDIRQAKQEGLRDLSFNDDKKYWYAPVNEKYALFAHNLGKKYAFIFEDEFQDYINRVYIEQEKAELPCVTYEKGKLFFNNLFPDQAEFLQEKLKDAVSRSNS